MTVMPAVLDSSSPPVVGCPDLSSGYRGRRALEGLAFELREPAVYVVLGPNGVGTTRLFRTLAGKL